MTLEEVAVALRRAVSSLRPAAPVAYVYNPLDYAWSVHRAYLARFGRAGAPVLLVGMNPGPWGMAQTGVPFGEVTAVRDWLGLSGAVGRPAREHPRRRVEGFACKRREVSGQRLWGWARDTFETPERFFSQFFVYNYCPLLFLEAGGRNLTPDRLPSAERRPLEQACDRALRHTVQALDSRLVVGVGAFAAERARHALADAGVRIGRVLHPSPASPAANRGWAAQVGEELARLGVDLP